MFRIAYEYPNEWPASGPLKIEAQFQGEIQIAPEEARREANQYITMDIGVLLGADDPMLLWGEHPIWRFVCYFHMPHVGRVGPVGTIDVDASTGAVIPLASETIHQIQVKASDLAARFSPQTEAVR